jgi:pimeloyl-ACP methyl ester carboxylesterase
MSNLISPTADQIHQTEQAIAAYVHSIDQHSERRVGAYPYCRFHPPGKSIRGTVMMFHGFSAKPHQMWRLTEYLFQNGFNVYQPSIAGHTLINPAKNWAQVDLKPEITHPLKAKVQQDPVLITYFANLATSGTTHPSAVEQTALLARLITLEPQLLDIIQSIDATDDPDFDRYFISSHENYLTDAEARLAELDAMPGDIFTVGLSVGGAVALGLAAARPDRVRRVVAYAPLLRVYGDDRRKYVNLAGPLDIKEMGWDATLQFPVGALTAADRFGGSVVMSPRSLQALHDIPTFLVLTENEDAADIDTNKDFFARIGGDSNGNHFYCYPAEDLVPHPMVDPTEVSQNMSNRFWQSLYQETFHFLTTGEVDQDNLSNLEQTPNLPHVVAV